MERESFEDYEVAELLNANYISIKVDREERPDIDAVYMRVCQMATGSGGWPLTVIMDAERKPFFAGTYFPKNDMGMRIGLITIFRQIFELWKNKRDKIAGAQKEIIETINTSDMHGRTALSVNTAEAGARALLHAFDSEYGGFGTAPKFPAPHNIMFLFRFWHEFGDDRAFTAAIKTLECMAAGGIRDHIGGGFCRYSTDRQWLAPHFEKMLYDNALLAIAYSEAFLITGDAKFKEIAEEILEYILRDMTSTEGGFYSAEDADSEGVEGKFYVWEKREVVNILGDADGERFCRICDITDEGNFEGKNIPNNIDKSITTAEKEFINSCKTRLFVEREKRPHPLKDKKILTSWNGLMIAALAAAGRIFDERKYVAAAEKAAQFIIDNLTNGNELYTRYIDGEILKKSFADDYACVIWGLTELYAETFKPKYLKRALGLTEKLLEMFCDDDSSGIFLYPKNSENILTRPKEIYDGALPSSNSLTAYNLIRLSRLTGNPAFEKKAHDMLEYFGGEIESQPYGFSFSLINLLYLNGSSCEIVITAQDEASATEPLSLINGIFLPYATILLLTPSAKRAGLGETAPFTAEYPVEDKGWAAYVCRRGACLPAIRDIAVLKNELNAAAK